MDSSPNIIFNLKAHQYYAPGTVFEEGSAQAKRMKESLFFRCQNSQYNIVNYLTRKKANELNDMQTLKTMAKLVEGTSGSAKDILDYAKNRPGSTGLWDREGDVDEQKLKEIRGQLKDTKSTVWSGVVSFTKEFAEQFCSNRTQAHALINQKINAFFENAGLNPENMNWYGAYHINTKSPHIHLIMWEQAPTKLSQHYSEPQYSAWNLPKQAMIDFKMDIAKHFNANKLDYFSLRDEIRQSLKGNLSSKALWESKLDKLRSALTPTHSWQYGRLSLLDRKTVNRFVDDFVSQDTQLKTKFDEYIFRLMATQKQFINLYKDNHEKAPENVLNFAQSRVDELYSRLGNELLHVVKNLPELQTGRSIIDRFQNHAAPSRPLSHYDNTFDRAQLTKSDLKILERITFTKNNAKFFELYRSVWENEYSEVTGKYKNIYAQTLAVCCAITKHTKDSEQIERIYKSSGLYRPELWTGQYNNQVNFLKVEGTLKNAALQFALDNQRKNEQYCQAQSQAQSEIRKAAMSYRQVNRSIMNLITRFINNGNTEIDNLHKKLEAMNRRKKAQGELIYDN